MAEPKIKVTLEELQNSNIEITKKFLLIDSSLYTDEAYEYLLSLVDKTESVAFISDRKLIYTQGDYFGGDIWKDSLAYFGDLVLVDPITGEEVTSVQAEYMGERLKLTSDGTIKIETEQEIKDGLSIKSLKFSFDLANSIDNQKLELSNGDAIFIGYDAGKIKLSNYIPISIEAEDPKLIEFDYNQSEIRIPLTINGNNGVRNISIYTSPIQDARIEGNELVSPISRNINQYFNISYNDGETYGVKSISQNYGFGLFYSTSEITNLNFRDCPKILTHNSCDCEFTINQNDGEYGWFACPNEFNPIFKDEESGFVGGWKKVKTLEIYSVHKAYSLYRTENTGLGKNKWIVKEIKY